MVEAFIVSDRDKGVEFLMVKLVLKLDVGIGDGGELGCEVGLLDAAIDCKGLGVDANIGDLIVMGATLKEMVCGALGRPFLQCIGSALVYG